MFIFDSMIVTLHSSPPAQASPSARDELVLRLDGLDDEGDLQDRGHLREPVDFQHGGLEVLCRGDKELCGLPPLDLGRDAERDVLEGILLQESVLLRILHGQHPLSLLDPQLLAAQDIPQQKLVALSSPGQA